MKGYKKIGNFKLYLLFLGILFVFSLSVSPSTAAHVDTIYVNVLGNNNWDGHSSVYNYKTVSDPKATLLNSTKSTQNKGNIADRTEQTSGKGPSKYKPPAVPGGMITSANNEYTRYVYPGSIDVVQGEKFFVQRPFDNWINCGKEGFHYKYQGYWNPYFEDGKGITLSAVNTFGAWFVCDGIIHNGTYVKWKTEHNSPYMVKVKMKVLGPISTHLMVDDVTGKYEDHVNLTAVLTDDDINSLSGKTITFAINDQTIGTAVTDSTGSATLSYNIKQTIGNYNITANFKQDNTHAASTSKGILKVNPTSTHLIVSNVTGKYGGHINFTAVLKDENNSLLSGKTITFAINDQTIGTAITDSTGSAKLSYKLKQTIGNYNITANFEQDNIHAASTSKGILKINPISTHLLVDDVTGKHGDHINFTAVLKDENNNPLSGKTIIFYLNGDKIGSKTTDSTGSATLSYNIKQIIGNYNITANFEQDDIYAASTSKGILNVNPTSTHLMVDDVTGKHGGHINFTAVLKDENNNPISGKTISFSINDQTIGTALTDSTGSATLSYNIKQTIGNYNITANFEQDDIYTASTNKGTLNVNQISTHLMVDDVTGKHGGHINFTAVLKDENNNTLSSKTITFAINDQTIGTAITDSTGSAKLSYNIKQTIGNYNITANFEQDDIYTASTNKGTLEVNPTNTHVMVKNVIGKYGSHINFTAVLKNEDNNPISGKTITFAINGQTIGTAITDNTGSATLSYIIKQTIGNYNITANFEQDDIYAASTSKGILEVNPTNTKFVVKNITVKNGDKTNLKAVLKDELGNPVSGKTIKFLINSKIIGKAITDVNGTANTYYITHSSGNFIVNTIFTGDNIYSGSNGTGKLNVTP